MTRNPPDPVSPTPAQGKARLVFRVTSLSPHFPLVMEQFAALLNALYPQLGSKVVIETILDGALFYFQTIEDFKTFHQIALRLPPVENGVAGHRLVLHVAVEQVPDSFTLEEVLPLITDAYAHLSADIEIQRVAPMQVDIIYPNEHIFEDILRVLRELLPAH